MFDKGKTEKTINGVIVGQEKHVCPYCKKETTMNVVYSKSIAAASSTTFGFLFGAVGGAVGALSDAKRVSRAGFKSPTYMFYICQECRHPLGPEIAKTTEKELKQKYGWSNFWGFKGKKQEKLVLNLS